MLRSVNYKNREGLWYLYGVCLGCYRKHCYYGTKHTHTVEPDSGTGKTPELSGCTNSIFHFHFIPLVRVLPGPTCETNTLRITVPLGGNAFIPVLRPEPFRHLDGNEVNFLMTLTAA
jgi:hypothetical protein